MKRTLRGKITMQQGPYLYVLFELIIYGLILLNTVIRQAISCQVFSDIHTDVTVAVAALFSSKNNSLNTTALKLVFVHLNNVIDKPQDIYLLFYIAIFIFLKKSTFYYSSNTTCINLDQTLSESTAAPCI